MPEQVSVTVGNREEYVTILLRATALATENLKPLVIGK
jgi:hypothetical protein